MILDVHGAPALYLLPRGNVCSAVHQVIQEPTVENMSVHKGRASKTKGTTPFGVRAPDFLLHEFEAARLRFRPDIQTRQDAVIEAMEQWIQRQREETRAVAAI